MRAYQLKKPGFDGIAASDLAQPVPGANQVLLNLRAASLNYHDLVTILGLNPKLKFPLIPLSDGCALVEAVGSEVKRFQPGDRVATHFFQQWLAGPPTRDNLRVMTGDSVDGTLCEYMVVSEEALVAVPEYLSDIQAATLTCAALTAWRAVVEEANIQAGDVVLVQGTGGVSLFALQFAKQLGATVILTSSSDEKLERAQNLGADHLINYQRSPGWSKDVKQITDKRGVDLVVEVGGSGTMIQSLGSVSVGGHISVIGVLSGFADVLPVASIMALNVTLRGITVGNRKQFESMLNFMQQHKIQPVISHQLGFADLLDGLKLLQSGQHFGKIALDYSR